jgi:hypothetical protein
MFTKEFAQRIKDFTDSRKQRGVRDYSAQPHILSDKEIKEEIARHRQMKADLEKNNKIYN